MFYTLSKKEEKSENGNLENSWLEKHSFTDDLKDDLDYFCKDAVRQLLNESNMEQQKSDAILSLFVTNGKE